MKRHPSTLLTLCLSLALYASAPAQAEPQYLKPTTAHMRLTYENLQLPGTEKMGMLGQAALFDVSPNISAGVQFYSALTGQRGGFIALGFVGEAHHKLWIPELEINAGLLVGAGGGRGGYALSGGGLVLRPHLGLNYQFGSWGKVGAGISYASFPDGSIHSAQPYVQYDMPFTVAYTHGWLSTNTPNDEASDSFSTNRQEFSPIYRHYIIPKGVKQDNGAAQYPMIGLLGIMWSQGMTPNLDFKFETEGAFRGQSHGYMQIFTGLNYRIPITSSTTIKAGIAAGVGGGGGVDTGGGFLLDSTLGIQQMLGSSMFVALTGGYVQAPGRTFKASSLALQFGERFDTLDIPLSGIDMNQLNHVSFEKIRIRAAHHSYLRADPQWRTHHKQLNMQNLGLQVDYFLSPYAFITGQAIAAYKGMGGAYMTGMLGAGVHIPLGNTPLFMETEALLGAAGGGGVDVRGGMVWQASASLGWQLSDAYSLMMGYGRMQSIKGNFKARLITAELNYKFGFFTN